MSGSAANQQEICAENKLTGAFSKRLDGSEVAFNNIRRTHPKDGNRIVGAMA